MMLILSRRRTTIARWCSDVGSPPVFTVLALALTASAGNATLGSVVAWSLGLSLLVAAVPLVYVMWLVQRGKVTDIHLPHRRERTGPIAVTLLTLVGAVAAVHALDAPELLQRFVAVCLAQSLLLGIVTLWWKISFHAAATALFVGTTLAVFGAVAAPALLLIPLIGWARLALHRHTLAQVVAGGSVGLIVSMWL